MKSFALLGLLACCGVIEAAEPTGTRPEAVAIRVVCHGRIRHGLVAVGGETTGTTLTFDGLTWELKLPDEASRRFAEAEHKQAVVVTGWLRHVRGVEVPGRWIVEVERLAKPDPQAMNDKPQAVLTGRLASATSNGLPVTIDVGGTSYAIAWPEAPAVRQQALALAGKPVVAMAAIEANTEGGPRKTPVFRILQLRAE